MAPSLATPRQLLLSILSWTSRPKLPSGGGNKALATALERNFAYSPDASLRDACGVLHYSAVVLQTGQLAALKLDDFSDGFLPRSLHEAIQEACRRLP